MPEPTPLPDSPWVFPPVSEADDHGVVAIGADLYPQTIVGAYRHGIFPMPIPDYPQFYRWWSPAERGVLELADLRVTRSLRRSCRRYEVTINADFEAVIDRCAHVDRPNGWLDDDFITAYTRLHELGWAHSIEVWDGTSLVGGLYGVQVGGLFAGESMFHLQRDASKVAVVALVSALEEVAAQLLDVQWWTPHLSTLGVTAISREDYAARLETAVTFPSRSLGAQTDPHWVANSRRFLDRSTRKPTKRTPSP